MKVTTLFLLLAYSFLFFFTRLSSFEFIPNPHYDEAWFIDSYLMHKDQGLWVVLSKTFSFYSVPLQSTFFWAMDKAGIALNFKSERLFYIFFNYFIGIFLALYCYRRRMSFFSTVVVVLGFASLPLFVFGARSYLEVTVFHVLVMVGWLLAISVKSKNLGAALCFFLAFIGTLFHTLFIFGIYAVVTSFFLLKNSALKKEILEKNLKWSLLGVVAALLKFELTKFNATILLAMVFGVGVILFSKNISRFAGLYGKLLFFFGPLLCAIFLILHWSGMWPYSHMTGEVELYPVLFLAAMLGVLFSRHKLWRELKDDATALFWLSCFTINSVGVLFFTRKLYATRYWMLPALFFLLFFARILEIAWSKSLTKKPTAVLAALWVLLNLVLFQQAFLGRMRDYGPKEGVYRWLAFKDDTNDYLPLDAARMHAKTFGCSGSRFVLPTPTYDRMGPVLAVYGKTEHVGTCVFWVGGLDKKPPTNFKDLGSSNGFKSFHVAVDKNSCLCKR